MKFRPFQFFSWLFPKGGAPPPRATVIYDFHNTELDQAERGEETTTEEEDIDPEEGVVAGEAVATETIVAALEKLTTAESWRTYEARKNARRLVFLTSKIHAMQCELRIVSRRVKANARNSRDTRGH